MDYYDQEKEDSKMEKWELILQNWDKVLKTQKFLLKYGVKNGVPDLLRGLVWQHFSGSFFRPEHQNYDTYLEYVERDNQEYESVIVHDIQRTFAKHPFFSHSTFGQNELYNILKAFANKNKDVGYCQGMGFVSAIFLTYMDEEAAFWMLDYTVKKHKLQGYFAQAMSSLNVAFYKLQMLIKKFLPKLHKHFIENSIRPSMYASQWFLTLFALNFSFDVLMRIWDVYLLEGEKMIYRVAIAILLKNENELLQKSFEDFMSTVQDVYIVENIEELISRALELKITNSVLDVLHLEFEDNPDEEVKELLLIQ